MTQRVYLVLGKLKDMSDKPKYTHKPDSGSLFVNTNKSKETQPDYTGSYTTEDGKRRCIAAWYAKTKNTEYLSVRFQDEYEASTN